MRVVAGSARGRRLVAPAGTSTRPTSDRVREAIMNALWSRSLLDGATVLDLFAGSGAMGIEALSRGASYATFVDADARARHAIAQNLEMCGFTHRAEVIAQKAHTFLARRHKQFDLAFCDPPYAFEQWPDLLVQLPANFVVIESADEVTLPAGWELVRANRYGAAWIGMAARGGPQVPILPEHGE